MGRQITVELAALKSAGCEIDFDSEVVTSDYRTWDGQDADSETVLEWAVVHLPDGRQIGSCFADCLNFDCRSLEHSPNAWMERWLIERAVPYVHG